MFRRVVDFYALPDSVALLLPEEFDQRLFLVGVQVIPDQVNRFGLGISLHNLLYHLGALRPLSIGGGLGELPSGLGLYAAKHVRGPSPLVFVVSLQNFIRPLGSNRRADVFVQGDGLFIQAHHRFLGVQGALVDFQDVLHLGHEGGGHFLDAPHFFPARA